MTEIIEKENFRKEVLRRKPVPKRRE